MFAVTKKKKKKEKWPIHIQSAPSLSQILTNITQFFQIF